MVNQAERPAGNTVQTQLSDVVIVGAGAAGLATAIFAARQNPSRRICLLDGAAKLGAKILVSGGGRCNVTNTVVTPDDFRGGNRNIIRRVLNALTVEQTVAFFRELGVTLHEEEHGKLFPDSNKARTVLDALLREAESRGVHILTGHRVQQIKRSDGGFVVSTSNAELRAPRIVLATGGLSLPKTGSDGSGYSFAQSLGHSLVPTTPALAPLVLDGDFHKPLSGISQEVELTVRTDNTKPVRLRGSMLWTHFGISGPVVLNASGLWHRARLQHKSVSITANLLPDETFESAERRLVGFASSRAKVSVRTMVSELLPSRVADAVLTHHNLSAQIPMAHLSRDERRKLLHALLEWPLPVRDSRGYAYAEVTAGGIPLDEIDPATMASRVCPGLYLVGEILDVDGRIGGFNFQWSWSGGKAVGSAMT